MGMPTQSQQALQGIGTNNYADAYKQSMMDDAQEAMGLAFANSDGGTGIPGYELLVAMTGVIVIMMVKNTKKKSTVSPIVP